jgi:5-oxopent-3-ene-1,2,5-tricarboxylate decarboxylase/2-hydroxyhepta-2,4-diene-1,7-dioate isomerase
VVSAAAFGDPGNVELRTLVDGDVRQRGSTAEMIRDIPQLLAFITGFMTLRAGDVVATGFPGGRVNVAAGTTVSIEANRIGRLTSPVVTAAEFEAGRAAA